MIFFGSQSSHLPWETIARGPNVGTVARVVNGPDAGWSFWPEMEPDDNVFKVLTDEINELHCNGLLFVKGECPLKSLFTLALVVAFWIINPTRELETWT